MSTFHLTCGVFWSGNEMRLMKGVLKILPINIIT